MFCPVCGSETSETANFCVTCGAECRKSNSNLPESTTSSSATLNQPVTFKEYMEKKCSLDCQNNGESPVDSPAFRNIKKRKKNERLSHIKRQKKDEIVKVIYPILVMVFF